MIFKLMNRLILRFFLSESRFLNLYEWSNPTVKPRISCVIPVFNQEEFIYSHLKSLVASMSQDFEVIVIDDASLDSSRNEVMRFTQDFSHSLEHLVGIRVFGTKISVYESRCEDFGFRKANGEYLFGIQSDMKVLHPEVDKLLIDTLESNPEIYLLSCRGVHKIQDLANPGTFRGRELADGLSVKYLTQPFRRLFQKFRLLLRPQKTFRKNENSSQILASSSQLQNNWVEIFPFLTKARAGWLGEKINYLPYEYDPKIAQLIDEHSGKVWKGETVMRGPIFIRRSDYIDLGGYNTEAFFQGLDDHDLSCRIRDKGANVAFTPIYFSSPLNLGPARKKKSLTQRMYSELNARVRRENMMNSTLFQKLRETT